MADITKESMGLHPDDPKADVVFHEHSPSEEERRLERATLRRLDAVLIPMTLMLYLLAWLDRANVGNARIVSYLPRWQIVADHGAFPQAGLDKDLNLSDQQYKTGDFHRHPDGYS